jgi:hypothetical protein
MYVYVYGYGIEIYWRKALQPSMRRSYLKRLLTDGALCSRNAYEAAYELTISHLSINMQHGKMSISVCMWYFQYVFVLMKRSSGTARAVVSWGKVPLLPLLVL